MSPSGALGLTSLALASKPASVPTTKGSANQETPKSPRPVAHLPTISSSNALRLWFSS